MTDYDLSRITTGAQPLPWPAKAEKRKCRLCSKVLKKRDNETPWKFLHRDFCNRLCASKASGWGRARFKDMP